MPFNTAIHLCLFRHGPGGLKILDLPTLFASGSWGYEAKKTLTVSTSKHYTFIDNDYLTFRFPALFGTVRYGVLPRFCI